MTAPEGDIADLGDLPCDLARSAAGAAIAAGAGSVFGEIAGDLVGRADAGVSVAETATGEGFC